MKRITYLLLVSLLWLITNTAFSGQAIHIGLSDANSNALNNDDINAIRKIAGQAISDGILSDFVIYNQGLVQPDKFFACAQATDKTTPESFNHFVNQLHAASPQTAINYKLRYATYCNKDSTRVCSDDTQSCLNSAIATNVVYLEDVTRGKFASALADINAGKVAMELKFINNFYAPTFTNPVDIGLPTYTKNCSTITIFGDATLGDADITCVIASNNPAINGATINLHRTGTTGQWLCTPTGSVGDITKYQGKCTGN